MQELILNNEVDAIKSGHKSVEQLVKETKKKGCKNGMLRLVRSRLTDDTFKNERSIYCGIIREFNDKTSLPLLWELLLREDTKGKRGSLVYAMEYMNPIEYFEQIIELIVKDNFEVVTNCLAIIDNLDGYVEADIIDRCVAKLNAALEEDLPKWKTESISILLEELVSE